MLLARFTIIYTVYETKMESYVYKQNWSYTIDIACFFSLRIIVNIFPYH